MKIAMPNEGKSINQHFGRSASFVIITIEEKAITNVLEISTENFTHQHDTLADLIVHNGATVVVTGGIGGGAMSKLKEKNLEVITGASGDYLAIAQSYIEGTLVDQNVACSSHGEGHHHNHEGHDHH